MLRAFRLIPALQVIFTKEIEFVAESFKELDEVQYASYRRDLGEPSERIFEIVAIERTAIKRTPEKISLEVNIVTETEKQLLLEGVKFIYHCTQSDGFPPDATFDERLEYLRQRLPDVMLTMSEGQN